MHSNPVKNVSTLARRYGAVFLAPGIHAALPDWPGVELGHVVTAEAFLAATRRNRYRQAIGQRVAIIGGGNVAIDAALAAVQCGRRSRRAHPPQVELLYRRTRGMMPAWGREIAAAEEAGVLLRYRVAPVALHGRQNPRPRGSAR